jgi:serine phosphatase RsbU (regulator of sigma subunit)/anti-sigma regulatory factor (Ser/Thr protein kinase)
MPWRIRTQTVLLSLVPLFFLCLLFVLALVMVNRTLDVAAWNQRSAQVIAVNDMAMRSLTQMGASLNAYTTERKPSLLTTYRSSTESLVSELRDLRRLTLGEPQEQRPIAAFTLDMNRAIVVLREYEADIIARQTARVKALSADPKTKRLGPALTEESADISTAQRKIALTRLDASRKSQQTFGILLLSCCLIGIVLTLAAALAFGFRVVRRLHDLATNAQRMATGLAPKPIRGADEIAELNNVYLEMTQRIQQEHRIAATLQRALLPGDLPLIDGLRIDTAYLPASLETEVGGDWYDVFVLTGSLVGISVGDVAGHGLKAASVMGTTRQAIRTAAGIDADPGSVLAHVNRALMRDEKDCVVTAFFATLDLEDGTLCYAIAGHPAPLVVRTDGRITPLTATGLILGVDSHAVFTSHQLRLEAGTGLVLYTDGIIELERNYFKGVQDLESAVRMTYDSSVSNIAEAIQQRIFAHLSPRDDSALLVVRILHLSPETLSPRAWSVDTADPQSARRVKRAVVAELARAQANVDFSTAELILGELLSNVARHTPGVAEVTLEWKNDDVLLHVVDRGEPFTLKRTAQPDMLAETGRGLFLVTSVSAGITVEQTAEGNRVTAILPARQA